MQRTAWLLAFVVALGACIGVWGLAVLSDRRTVLHAAETQLSVTARLLEEHADRALEAGHRAVDAAADAAGDARLLRNGDRAAALHLRLAGIVADSPQLASAWVMDAEGFTLAENWAHPSPTTGSFIHRDYFQYHLQGGRERHIGPMAIGPSARRPRFTLSRALLTPAGDFAGVAVVGVFSDYFAAVYAEAGLGAGARLALFRADGARLAVWPPSAEEPAFDLPGGIPAEEDGQVLLRERDRLLVMRRLERFPAMLAVSQPIETVLLEWEARTRRTGLVMAAIIGTLAGLTLFGLRGARAQQALTAALEAERGALEGRVAERTGQLAESEARFRDMADSAPVIVWMSDAQGACTFLARSWQSFTGQTLQAGLGLGWLDAVHPDDRDRVRQAVLQANAGQSPFRIEYRLRHAADDTWRFALADGAPRHAADGSFLGTIGSIVDITDRREAEERQALMARELDHRAKNALSVVQAALRLTPKHDAESYARAVEGRVAALARAHSALAEGRWQGVALRALAEAELATFLPACGMAPEAGRVALEGPDLVLNPSAAQALSMALHELATNATKHGALGVPGGRVALSWSACRPKGLLTLRWEERGGPVVAGPPQRRGFGSRVIETTIGQLGGRAEQRWDAAGMSAEIELPLGRVLAVSEPMPLPGVPVEPAGELALLAR